MIGLRRLLVMQVYVNTTHNCSITDALVLGKIDEII